MSKKRSRKKHVPQRTCVGCRKVNSKRSLIRIVRTSDGIIIDSTGKVAGRGAYLHNQRSCWELALEGKLSKALRTEISESDKRKLYEYMKTLPEEVEYNDQDVLTG